MLTLSEKILGAIVIVLMLFCTLTVKAINDFNRRLNFVTEERDALREILKAQRSPTNAKAK